jgi:hypothetical protein
MLLFFFCLFVTRFFFRFYFRFMCKWSQYFIRTDQIRIHHHNRSGIIEFAAIIGSREDRHQLSIGLEFISVFDYLMCSYNDI